MSDTKIQRFKDALKARLKVRRDTYQHTHGLIEDTAIGFHNTEAFDLLLQEIDEFSTEFVKQLETSAAPPD